MSKKTEKKWKSFTDTDGRWMQCKHCYDYVQVDENTAAISCSSCTLKRALALKPLEEFFAKKHKPTGRPAGWHWMAEYVDKDGNVFHKGKEQPELKGTLKPTKVKPRKKKKKLTEDQKLKRDIKRWNKRKKLRRGKK